MAIDLRGKPIIITGASSGIGAATALACAQAGMPVALAARRLDKLEALVQRLRASGAHAIAVQTDVTDPAQCAALVDRAERELGSTYAVFANAGYGVEQTIEGMTDAEVREMFEVNFFGSLNVIRPVLARLRSRALSPDGTPRGHVLWCSSCLANLPTPYCGVYSATKAAQQHLSRAMRTELRSDRIEVSSVQPIGTRTEFFETAVSRSPSPRVMDTKDSPFMQDASVVAGRVVRCLCRPRAEVWTGLPAIALRLVMAGAAFMPNLADPLIGRAIARRRAARASKP